MTTLGPPDHGAIGCADIEVATRFFAAFGFTPASDAMLPVAIGEPLYGLADPAPQRWLTVPGARRGGIRLIEGPRRHVRDSTLDAGGYAIDVYSRDIKRSHAMLATLGLRSTGIVRWNLGAAGFAQVRVDGPDGLRVIVAEGARRASVLDHDEDWLHSEAQSYVFVVNDVGDDEAFWRTCGLAPLYQATLALPPGFGELLDLPEHVTTMGLALHWCPDRPDGAARIELLGLAGDAGGERGSEAGRRLAAGLTAVCFAVNDVTATAGDLAAIGVPLAVTTTPDHPAVAYGVSPAGVPFEIWPV